MTSPHEHEDRELVSQMERALATAVSTTSALIEAFMRRQQRNAERIAREAQQQSVAEASHKTGASFGEAADRAQLAVTETRRALGVGQSDPSFWQTASDAEITNKIRVEFGTDPSRIGSREHDRHWATRADAGEILDVYESARRWSHSSLAAEKMADNIGELLQEYGVDVDTVASLPREEAAEYIATARAGHYARPGAEEARDADDISRLIDARDAAFGTADHDAARATENEVLGDAMTRTSEVLHASLGDPGSEASAAAILAVDDHPTHPHTAVAAGKPKAAAKARPAKGAQRGRGGDRSHGM